MWNSVMTAPWSRSNRVPLRHPSRDNSKNQFTTWSDFGFCAMRVEAREPLAGETHGRCDRRVRRKRARIEQDRVRSDFEGGSGAMGIPLIARTDVGEHVVVMGVHTAVLQFLQPALCTYFGSGG